MQYCLRNFQKTSEVINIRYSHDNYVIHRLINMSRKSQKQSLVRNHFSYELNYKMCHQQYFTCVTRIYKLFYIYSSIQNYNQTIFRPFCVALWRVKCQISSEITLFLFYFVLILFYSLQQFVSEKYTQVIVYYITTFYFYTSESY